MKAANDIIPLIGNFGRYQFFLFCYTAVLSVIGCTVSFSHVFMAAETEHWCRAWPDENCTAWPELRDNCTAVRKSIALPPATAAEDKYPYSSCLQYEQPAGYVFDPYMPYGDVTNYTYNEIPCTDGWEHDTSQYTTTIISEFHLVCELKSLPSLAQSIYFVGYLVGSFVWGSLSDWIGRKKTTLFAVLFLVVGTIVTTFSVNIYMYMAFRFIAGMGNIGASITLYVLRLEYVGKSWRTRVGMVGDMFFAIGYFVLAVIAMYVREWRTLSLIISATTVILIFPLIFVQESFSWLISKGRFEEAERVIRRVGKINQRTLPDVIFDKEDMQEEEESKKPTIPYSVIDLFKTPNMALRTLNMMFNWLVNSLVYYGLSQSTGDLGVDEYWAFFVSGAVEIPAYIYAMFGVEWFGRKLNTSILEIIGGVACLATIFISIGIWRTVVSMLGKFCISVTFSIIYLYTVELFPTPVRTIGLGMNSVASRVGGILSPIILLLGDSQDSLPSIVFGSSAVAAGLLVLFLPETKGRQLPQTMKEGEELGKCRCLRSDVDNESISELHEIGTNTEGALAISNPAFDTKEEIEMDSA